MKGKQMLARIGAVTVGIVCLMAFPIMYAPMDCLVGLVGVVVLVWGLFPRHYDPSRHYEDMGDHHD